VNTERHDYQSDLYNDTVIDRIVTTSIGMRPKSHDKHGHSIVDRIVTSSIHLHWANRSSPMMPKLGNKHIDPIVDQIVCFHHLFTLGKLLKPNDTIDVDQNRVCQHQHEAEIM
jgi:hypothetical protein